MREEPLAAADASSLAGLRVAVRPDLREAILRTIAYADVFDFPLTPFELHRYLVGVAALPSELGAHLRAETGPKGRLSVVDGLICLRGREELAGLRRERAGRSRRFWPRARYYGRLLGSMPFVRSVALTGSLAVGNMQESGDIDYLMVTAAGRLWLCRALTIVLVRWAALRGTRLCPNYFLSEDALQVGPPDLYQAHELAQMAPLIGREIYVRMRLANFWSLRFLPNALGPPLYTPPEPPALFPTAKRWWEARLRGRLGERLEAWERERKIRRFTEQEEAEGEAAFCPDQCKGHFDGHARRALSIYARRLEELGVAVEPA